MGVKGVRNQESELESRRLRRWWASHAEVFSFFQGAVGGEELTVEGEGAAFQRAVIDVQGDTGRGHVEGAPGGGGAPETAVAGRGFDGDGRSEEHTSEL